MGLFDYVDFEMDCPKCGARLTNFQTKDGDVFMNKVSVWSVDNFGAWCDRCKTSIAFYRKRPTEMSSRPTLEDVLKDYDMTAESFEGGEKQHGKTS